MPSTTCVTSCSRIGTSLCRDSQNRMRHYVKLPDCGKLRADGATVMSELKFNYKIEPKPGGGFIARPSNPALPVFEGATKEEVEQKMEARLLEMMDEKLDQLHLGNLKAAIHTKVNIQHHHITAPPQPTASQPQHFSS